MLIKIDLVILNELVYLPFSPSGGALLFHLLSKLYKRTSVVITTKARQSQDLALALQWQMVGIFADPLTGRRW